MALGRDRREAAIMSASRQNPTTTRLAKIDPNQATLAHGEFDVTAT
jgi:hypothetical protein